MAPFPLHLPARAAPRRILGLALLALGACGPADSPRGPRRNVVLITLDTTRADHLGCYGHGVDTSPNFDTLAREGARFELCISTSAVTPVSHASILSGQNPYRHGLRVLAAERGCRLPDDVPTLASVLEAQGFATGAFLSALPVSEVFGFDRGFDRYDNGLVGPAQQGFQTQDGKTGWDLMRYQRRSDETTDSAIEWMSGVEGSFFAWIHYWDPHDLGQTPPLELMRRFAPGMKRVGHLDPRLYDAEIYYVDEQFGRLVEAMKRAGTYEDTIFVVTSDHGEGWGEHDWQFHRILYQEQIHLPLIVRGPGVPGGTTVPDLVRSTDIFPTVLELLGVEAPAAVDGRSLTGLMRGEEDEPRIAYADQLNLYDTNAKMLEKRPLDDILHVAMDRRWKLIFRPTAPDRSELYDLVADPDEATNLYAADHPEARRLKADLDRRAPYVTEGFGTLDEQSDMAKGLGALGYMDDDGEEDEETGGTDDPDPKHDE